MKLSFLSLASGSSGNCYYLGTPEFGVLIDAGIGIRTIKKVLKDKAIDFSKIVAVLITHLSREDKNVMTQWAFVTLGKTDAAKQITVIPESKNKQVNKEAKKRMTRLMTEACAREAANVALHESKSGLQDAAAQLGIRLAKEQLKDKTDEALANLLNPGTANVLRGAEVLKGFFKKPQ